MPSKTYWKKGDWNGICQRCGFEFKFSELRKTWDGLWVCQDDWEPRQPQDYVRGLPDNQSVPVTSPESPDTFEAFFSTILTQAASSGDLSIQVASTPTWLSSRVSNGNYFYLNLEYANPAVTTYEIVKLTAVNGKVLTVTRAQLTTTARNFAIGDYVKAYLITQDVTPNIDHLSV